MSKVKACQPPSEALLNRYSENGHYTDCYTCTIDKRFSHAEFVNAFYTTWLFKVERFILKWVVDKPSTDAQAYALANGDLEYFAAWTVEGRAQNQLLMCDFQQKTRSFLMLETIQAGQTGEVVQSSKTSLYFGSAIVASQKSKNGDVKLSWFFRALLGFHKLYSIALLKSAKSRLLKSRNKKAAD